MNQDLIIAKKIYNEGRHSCVLVKGQEIIIKDGRGIKPIIDIMNSETQIDGFSVADKIVGKAAAMLYALSRIKEIYAEVISESAILIFNKYNIEYSYNMRTAEIINRLGTDVCPMEKIVKNIDSLQTAYQSLKEDVLVRSKMNKTKE